MEYVFPKCIGKYLPILFRLEMEAGYIIANYTREANYVKWKK